MAIKAVSKVTTKAKNGTVQGEREITKEKDLVDASFAFFFFFFFFLLKKVSFQHECRPTHTFA